MTELEVCIHFWESKLRQDKFLLEPTTLYFVELTVRALKELNNLKTRDLAEKLQQQEYDKGRLK